MEKQAAEVLVSNLRRNGSAVRDKGRQNVRLRASIEGDRVVFSGGLWGSATIDLSVSSRARILAHWDGYCAAHTIKAAPTEGESIFIVLGSKNTTYQAHVLKASPLRTTVRFKYNYGRVTERTMRTADIQF